MDTFAVGHQMYKRAYKRRRKAGKGVPTGYFEDWKYVGRWKERKVRKGLWVGRFRATKTRMNKVRGWGSFGKGTKGRWKIVGVQDVVKVGKKKYLTDFKFVKKPVYFKVKKGYRR